MSPRRRFAHWLGAGCAGVLALLAVAALVIGAGHPDEDQAVLRRVLDERAPALVFFAALLPVVVGAVVGWIIRRYVTAVRSVAEQTRVLLANPGYRVAPAGAPESTPRSASRSAARRSLTPTSWSVSTTSAEAA